MGCRSEPRGSRRGRERPGEPDRGLEIGSAPPPPRMLARAGRGGRVGETEPPVVGADAGERPAAESEVQRPAGTARTRLSSGRPPWQPDRAADRCVPVRRGSALSRVLKRASRTSWTAPTATRAALEPVSRRTVEASRRSLSGRREDTHGLAVAPTAGPGGRSAFATGSLPCHHHRTGSCRPPGEPVQPVERRAAGRACSAVASSSGRAVRARPTGGAPRARSTGGPRRSWARPDTPGKAMEPRGSLGARRRRSARGPQPSRRKRGSGAVVAAIHPIAPERDRVRASARACSSRGLPASRRAWPEPGSVRAIRGRGPRLGPRCRRAAPAIPRSTGQR